MEDATDTPRQVFVVTGPLRDRLYERFHGLFFGRDDVHVIRDVRRDERRQEDTPAERDRRTAERRQCSASRIGPPDWPFVDRSVLASRTLAPPHPRHPMEEANMFLMGESINGTRKQVSAAIEARDVDFIKTLASDQVNAGADLLDVNGGVAGGDEVADILWLIDVVMGVTDMRLMVDSASPEALDAGVRSILDKGGEAPFINSISGEQARIDAVLPLVREFKCPVVGLCLSDEGVPPTAEARFAVAQQMYELCTAAGLPPEDLWIDPLVLTVSADGSAARVTMDTLKLIKANLPTRTTGGLSNVSFGLPNRPLLNRTFVGMCAGLGIDGVVVDVRNKAMMATIKSIRALRGEDNYCGGYLKAHRAGLLK